MALNDLTDEVLMQRYADGEARAFEILLSRHRRPIFNFIFRYVGNRATAEDLLQDVFLRIIRAADSYQQRAKFTTWLYTIARNICVDHARRMTHRRAASLDKPLRADEEGGRTLGDTIASDGAGTDRQALAKDIGRRIDEAVAALGDEQREVFLMREHMGLPFKEIAEIVGVPENTVKSRMRYALEKLREALSEFEDHARQLG